MPKVKNLFTGELKRHVLDNVCYKQLEETLMWSNPQVEEFDEIELFSDFCDFTDHVYNIGLLRRYFEEDNKQTVLDKYKRLAHDFILSRDGHGAGFWDRGMGSLGEQLTKCAESFGSTDSLITKYKQDDLVLQCDDDNRDTVTFSYDCNQNLVYLEPDFSSISASDGLILTREKVEELKAWLNQLDFE